MWFSSCTCLIGAEGAEITSEYCPLSVSLGKQRDSVKSGWWEFIDEFRNDSTGFIVETNDLLSYCVHSSLVVLVKMSGEEQISLCLDSPKGQDQVLDTSSPPPLAISSLELGRRLKMNQIPRG